ncbi:hypothetical protein DPMN_162562 [Dreissena polymorpha]|uniref:Uncharacterized protein n=1 Tax=Dreissena polymorpha TaxID=45954 RepID=A0A9D4EUB8_DREPO|nr:hypothetical protein DPMN_162562 [Dreissena polymorpha]
MSVPATTFRVPKTEDWDMEIRLSEIKKTVTPKTEDWDAEIAVAKRPPFFLSVGKMTQRQINRLNRCWTCRCVPVNYDAFLEHHKHSPNAQFLRMVGPGTRLLIDT